MTNLQHAQKVSEDETIQAETYRVLSDLDLHQKTINAAIKSIEDGRFSLAVKFLDQTSLYSTTSDVKTLVQRQKEADSQSVPEADE